MRKQKEIKTTSKLRTKIGEQKKGIAALKEKLAALKTKQRETIAALKIE